MERAKALLKQYYGYDHFRAPQEEIIQTILRGQDCIALLPTGFGKSVTFQIPALLLEGVTIVLSPLIALMEDQVLHLKEKGISAAVLHSNLTMEAQGELYQRLEKGKIKILYVSAERLQNEYFLKKIRRINVSFIAVDEAHTILWAEGFRKAFGQIKDFIHELPKRPKILALTATATAHTIEKIQTYLTLKEPAIIQTLMDRKNISYKVVHPKHKDKYLCGYLQKHFNQVGIVYCLTRKNVEGLSKRLNAKGISNVIYHGGLNVEAKMHNQASFMNHSVSLMICTNAFGMGIDIPDIRFVVNYDLPASIEDLVQQMGRAARDGGEAEAVVIFSYKDIETIEYFIHNIEVENRKMVQRDQRKKLNEVIKYCHTTKCRHQFICSYFGQKIKKCGTHCDNCKK